MLIQTPFPSPLSLPSPHVSSFLLSPSYLFPPSSPLSPISQISRVTLYRPSLVHTLSNDIHDPAQSARSNRNADGGPSVGADVATDEALSTVHSNTSHCVLPCDKETESLISGKVRDGQRKEGKKTRVCVWGKGSFMTNIRSREQEKGEKEQESGTKRTDMTRITVRSKKW